MVRKYLPKLILFAAMTGFFSFATFGQDDRPNGPPPQDARFGPPPGQPGEPRPKLLQELGLTREQLQAVRRLNQDRKPVEEAARKRFQEANRALNTAIYADAVDDNEYRARLAEFQAAQAELARIKFGSELAVRRLLTPAQLIRFRSLRQRFAEARENPPEGRPGGERPIQRFRRANQPPTN